MTSKPRPRQEEQDQMVSSTLPPGPRSWVPLFTTFAFRKDPIGYLTSLFREYGDLVQFRGNQEHLFLVSDPDDIQRILTTDNKNFTKSTGLDRTKPLLGEGLLTSEGQFHRRQRRLVLPAFHRKRIAAYADIFASYTEQHQETWESGQTIDIADEMMRLTLKIVGKTLFDHDVSKEATRVGHALERLMQGWWLGLLLPKVVFEFFLKLPLPILRNFLQSIDELDNIIYRLIDERRESGEDHGDLLSMLIQSVDEEENIGQMTNQQARDEAMTLFLAGHETTANALAWSFYLLAQNPDCFARLQEEVDTVLGDRQAGFDDIPNLVYTEMVLSEAMRMYPPAWTIGRKSKAPYSIKNYTIPEGSTVLMSQYIVHHDERHFPNPEKFDPLRWTPEAKSRRHKFSYFPFGGGLRRCIGEAFAWMEGTILLATLAKTWSMTLAPNQTITLLPRITLRPQNGIQMILQRRNK